jgi:hypothetical protein
MSTDVDREYTRNTTLQLWPINEYFTTSNSGRTATHLQGSDWDTIYLTYPRLLSEGGKYYFEVSVDDLGGGTFCVGVQDGTEDIYTYLGDTSAGWGYMSNGRFYNSGVSYAPDSYVVGDVIGVAIDLDNGYIWWAKNNVWQDSGDPENGTNPSYTNLGTVTQIYPGMSMTGLGADGTIAFFESDGTYDAPAGFYYWGEEPYIAGDIDDPEIGFSEETGANFSLANRGISDGVSFSEVVGGGIYELIESHYFGNNNEGADSPTTTVGSPTLYDEWVTFDGNDGYGYTDHFVEDEVDVKVVFRIEEATDEIDGVRCIWKSGGSSNGIGFGISTDPDGVLSGYHIGAFAVDGGVRSGIAFPVENLLINTWYEAFITKEKITIRMQASPSVGFTRYGTLTPDDGTAPESVGYADTQSPLTGVVASGEYFIGSVASTEVFSEYTMDMPDDLSAPTYTPIEVFDFGSLYDGKAPTRFVSEIGTVSESTDHIEFDGTEGLYAGDDWGDETLLEFVVGFSVDSFSSAATFYKSGGSSNGVGVGIDASGNIGIFGMDDDSLSSITVSSTTLSTGTQYILYATQTEVRIYDAALTELLLRSTGSISIAAGTSYESLGFSQNGSPITAGTGNCDYLDGKLYFFELWLVGQLAFPVLNVEEKELDEDLGFADTIDGEIVTAIEYFSNVIGINDLIVGEKVSSQKEAESGIGFTVVAGVDHIDESTGELDEEIGFNDEIGVHQQTYSIGFSSSVGFNDEPEAYNAVTRIGNISNFGVNDSVDVLKQNNQTQENFGLDDTIGANITEIEGASEDIGFSDEIDGRLTLVNVGQSSFIGFDDSVYGGNPFSPDNEGNIGFNVEAEVSYYPVKGFSDIIGFFGETRNVKQYALGIEEGIGFNVSPIGENAGDLLEKIPANVTYKFYLTLTGANDGLDDYEITRLKTIQFRMKSGSESSYLGITAMYSQAAETEIDARSNGTLVLEMASVYEGLEVLRETLMEVSFSDVRYDLGSSSQSITINGYGTLSYDVDVVYLANAIAKKTTQNGRVNYRFARPNFYLRPGYKVVYGVENFTADEVSFYVGENKFYMDVYFDPSTLSGLNTNEIYRRYSLPTDRKRRFFAKLTGSQDATDDYIFSGIIDIQVRLNFGKKSYASINVLHSQEAQDAIVARPNGDIVIEVIDGVGASLEEFVTVNFNEVSYNLLPSSRTITLVGYKTIQFTSGVIFEPTEVIAKGVDGGGFANITSNVPNLSVTPGFNIVYDGLDFIAGEVYFNFQQFSQQMSIKDTITITTENPSDTELGLTGSVVSNIFYRDNHSESILGIDNFSNVSINDVEEAHHDTCEIGFRGIINAELNPLF